MDIKNKKEAFAKIAKKVTKELPQPQKEGLMAAPVKEEAV
jgi:hypothetical protein